MKRKGWNTRSNTKNKSRKFSQKWAIMFKKQKTNKQEPRANSPQGVTNFLIIPQQYVTYLGFKCISAPHHQNQPLSGSSKAHLIPDDKLCYSSIKLMGRKGWFIIRQSSSSLDALYSLSVKQRAKGH